MKHVLNFINKKQQQLCLKMHKPIYNQCFIAIETIMWFSNNVQWNVVPYILHTFGWNPDNSY